MSDIPLIAWEDVRKAFWVWVKRGDGGWAIGTYDLHNDVVRVGSRGVVTIDSAAAKYCLFARAEQQPGQADHSQCHDDSCNYMSRTLPRGTKGIGCSCIGRDDAHSALTVLREDIARLDTLLKAGGINDLAFLTGMVQALLADHRALREGSGRLVNEINGILALARVLIREARRAVILVGWGVSTDEALRKLDKAFRAIRADERATRAR